MNPIKKIFVSLLVFFPSAAFASLNVVTTLTDFASIAKEVGGNHVEVTSLAKGYQDPHFVEAKPSYLLKLRKADLFIEAGLELEVAWAPPLLTNSRNSKILPGNPGFLDVSEGCEILQKVQGSIDRSSGDVHPYGNPHYWLDPQNGHVIARHIAEKFVALDPENTKDYQSNLETFETKLSEKEKEWDGIAAGFKNQKVITYHNSWPNFAKRFGLDVVNFIEPKPGIPPTPTHIQKLRNQIRDERIPVILMEPYFDTKLPAKLAAESGAQLLVFPPSVGAEKEIVTYFDLFDHNLELLKRALKRGN